MKAIVSYFPEFRTQVMKELAVIDAKQRKRFTDLISLVESPLEGIEANQKLLASKPVFIRHIFPVLAEGIATADKDETCARILEAVVPFCKIAPGEGFAVQCRLRGTELDWTAKDVEVFIGKHFDALGGIPVFADKRIINEDIWIISIFLYGNQFYAGFSRASQNLSSHSDEHRVLSRDSREISRAEKKLKEAINAFHIEVAGNGNALDMGASPGGWTKVLADYGFHVSAVDPGDLHESLRSHPRIKHYKARVENVRFDIPFEIIVNDMNVDPQITAEIMNNLAERLVSKGLAIVTLKLPFSDVDRSVRESLAILDKEYTLLHLRNLSHNRSEITAVIQRKN